MAKAKDKELNFEDSLGTLEKIVTQLESGDLPLERALELFEDGVGLARRCQTQLEEAERKVELLLRERGEIRTVPFEPKADASSREGDVKNVFSLSQDVPAPFTGSQISRAEKDDDTDDTLDESIPF